MMTEALLFRYRLPCAYRISPLFDPFPLTIFGEAKKLKDFPKRVYCAQRILDEFLSNPLAAIIGLNAYMLTQQLWRSSRGVVHMARAPLQR